MRIGPYTIHNRLVLAPMAGITDRPFRQLCRQFGAGLAVSEMVSANALLWGSKKTRRRLDHEGEDGPHSVQIVGADPYLLAQAAKYNADKGAQIIDINMGCPAKKVCNAWAGSALLRDERRVAQILTAVVSAVDIPVTLKIRTGWDRDNRNGIRIARIAEQSGIQAIAVHGRTRACGFRGKAEYDTIAAIKQGITIPVIANGDIDTPEQAEFVLEYTGADAIMIGRAAQGRPWIFREIDHYLTYNQKLPAVEIAEIRGTLLKHLTNIHEFYGEYVGVRMARKHISWYSKTQPGSAVFRYTINMVDTAQQQLAMVQDFFSNQSITQPKTRTRAA